MGSKKFFHDTTVLLLLSVNLFLVLATCLLILLRISDSTHASGLTIQYRSNLSLNESRYQPGTATSFVGFVVFLLLVMYFHVVLAKKTYHLRRHFSVAVMAMGTLLILLAAIISNALLSI